MAITATMAVSSATCTAEQKVTATLTVSNSGSSAVNVTSIAPKLTPHSATMQSVSAALGVPPLGGAFSVSVAGSGSSTFSFDVVPHAPTTSYGNAEPASFVYDVGATVITSDGSITEATTTTLTVSNPSLT